MQRRLFTVISALVIMFNTVLSPLAGATATVSDHAWQGAPKATGNDCIDEDQGTRPDCRTVMATHVAGGWVYAGGSIDGVRSGNGSIKYTQFRNLFRYNPVTGAVDTSFAPHFYNDSSTTTTPDYSVVPSGMVRKIVSGPGSSIFVAGDFRQVKSSSTGKIYTQRGLAKINTTNGDVDRTFKPNIGCIAMAPIPCTIFTTAYIPSLNYVMVGGLFNKVNGVPETGFVILDAVTGATIPNTTVTLAANLHGQAPHVRAIAINPVNDREFFVGGGFSQVKVYPVATFGYRYNAFKLQFDANKILSSKPWNAIDALSASRPAGLPVDLAKGATKVGQCSVRATWIRQMTYSSDGQNIIFGSGGGGAGDIHPALCDTVAMFKAGPESNGTYNPYIKPIIYNHTPTDTIMSICVLGNNAYIGGHFRGLNFVTYKNGVKTGGVNYYTGKVGSQYIYNLSQAAPNAHFGIASVNLNSSAGTAYGLAEPTWNLTALVSAGVPTSGVSPFPWSATAATDTGRGYGWAGASCVPASKSPTGKDLVIMGGDGSSVNGDASRTKLAQFNGL